MGTEVAKALARRRDAILADWVDRISDRPQAKKLSREAILNNFPEVVDELIAALGKTKPRGAVIDIPRAAAEKHGQSRLELGYGLRELGEEYNSLREALLAALEAEGIPLENDVAGALHGAVDQAHRAGVERFIELREERLRQAQSDFLARLTHDFRTPLTSVLAATAMLRRQLASGDAPAAEKSVERIERSAHRLLVLIEGQLATEQALSGALEPHLADVDVASVFDDVIDVVSSRAHAKGIRLKAEVAPGLVTRADRMLLVQVVQNLADNALKYTDVGSVSLVARAAGDKVRITVRDTGRGIAREQVARMFDMYTRSENVSQGHGVGLAVVKAAVLALHGTIEVESAEGRGTSIDILLPRGSSPQHAEHQPHAP